MALFWNQNERRLRTLWRLLLSGSKKLVLLK
jgi:hypothetical protein